MPRENLRALSAKYSQKGIRVSCNVIKTISALTITLVLSACSTVNNLNVIHISDTTYQCEQNQNFTVRYFALSDQSLSLVKFQLDSNADITLPQQPTASGASYSNGSIRWITKGTKGTLEVIDQNQTWQTMLADCAEK